MKTQPNIQMQPQKDGVAEELNIRISGRYERIVNHQIHRIGASCIDEAILIYCVSGTGWLQVDDNKKQIEKGNVIFIDRNVAHAYGSNANNPWTIQWVHFNGPFTDLFAANLQAVHSSRVLQLGYQTNILQPMEHANHLLSSANHPYARLAANSYLKVSLIELLIHNNEQLASDYSVKAFIQTSMDFMQQHVTEKLSLDDIAHEINLTKFYYSRQFKMVTGLSPMAWLSRAKIQKACELLMTGEYQVQEVSRLFGFSTPYHFSEVFKKRTGFSPRAYIKMKHARF